MGLVWLTQLIPALATFYSQTVYPCFSYILSSFSNLFPFAIGDLFIFLSIAGIIIYPIYTRLRKKTPWKKILLRAGVTAFTLEVRADNAAAVHVYEKLGFRTVGRLERFFRINGQYHAALLMELDA